MIARMRSAYIGGSVSFYKKECVFAGVKLYTLLENRLIAPVGEALRYRFFKLVLRSQD